MTSDIVFPVFSSCLSWLRWCSPMCGPGAGAERSEAYFRSMFAELQPHFHPEKVLRFVRERKLPSCKRF